MSCCRTDAEHRTGFWDFGHHNPNPSVAGMGWHGRALRRRFAHKRVGWGPGSRSTRSRHPKAGRRVLYGLAVDLTRAPEVRGLKGVFRSSRCLVSDVWTRADQVLAERRLFRGCEEENGRDQAARKTAELSFPARNLPFTILYSPDTTEVAYISLISVRVSCQMCQDGITRTAAGLTTAATGGWTKEDPWRAPSHMGI